jgi:sporulation protein YlmC with PRC-barrel domain
MPDILAENLSDKTVVGSDGAELGQLHNITMDLKTGTLHDLVVDPGENAPRDADFEFDEAGRYLVPVANVQAVKDHIVVSR